MNRETLEHVILVDENDQPIGSAEKLEAHKKGLCHRAFSVFIFQEAPEPYLLLQQRASNKYHSSNLWTNTCCSHPRVEETVLEAGYRRLREEMGIETKLEVVDKFHYIAIFDNGLIENEVDHVLVGCMQKDKPFEPNPEEARDCCWIALPALHQKIASHPEQFTPWLKEALKIAENWFLNKGT